MFRLDLPLKSIFLFEILRPIEKLNKGNSSGYELIDVGLQKQKHTKAFYEKFF